MARELKAEIQALRELASLADRGFIARDAEPTGLRDAVAHANNALQIVHTLIGIDNARFHASVSEQTAKRERDVESSLLDLLAEQRERLTGDVL